jgi:hypothetical protein
MAEPIATDIQQQFRTLDPTTRELFFGSGIPGTSSYSPGFMQQAFRASEKTFYDEQGNPIVVPEQVAGLSPEQLAAINLSREKIGVQDPYLQQSQQAYGSGLESLFGGLGESEQALRDYASAEYDPSSYQQYMDPYQEQVIDQVRKDILEQGAKGDISARASDIARGGESAFGSRARLGAGERTEALGRGLGEALGGLRSQGFQQAQQTAMGEFGRQQQAQQGLAQGLGSLAGARQAGTIRSRTSLRWSWWSSSTICSSRHTETTGLRSNDTRTTTKPTQCCKTKCSYATASSNATNAVIATIRTSCSSRIQPDWYNLWCSAISLTNRLRCWIISTGWLGQFLQSTAI